MNNRDIEGLSPKEIALKILEQQQVVKKEIILAEAVLYKDYTTEDLL